MSESTVGFLGPEGTFAHLAAQRRFGARRPLVGFPTVKEVFDFVNGAPNRVGIVPVENSSGGTIYETVDRLVDQSYNLFIQESLSINVRLALMGKEKDRIRIIYSHFAPLQHCEQWIRTNYPAAECKETSSTAKAVQAAALDPEAAAIGNRQAGKIYKLKVLEFPIQQDVPNVTQFFVLGHKSNPTQTGDRTTLIVSLHNKPGELVNFLEPFKDEGIDLTRIISRPIVGKPSTYVFLVDVKGRPGDPRLRRALKKASNASERMKSIGSYPIVKRYES
jgi:chorismate mutase/prephenate dehydratase